MKYVSTCGCEFTNEHELPEGFTSEEYERIMKSVFTFPNAKISRAYDWVYNFIAKVLLKGATKGVGKDLVKVDLNKPDGKFLQNLQQNTYFFSGAKTYQQIKDVNSLLIKDGKRQAFADFKTDALPVLQDYNENWLKTEYNLAIGNGRQAADWQEYEADKETFPFLQYITAKDGRVRDEHAELDGIIKEVDHPFWDTFMPTNGWNCRCRTIKLDEGSPTSIAGKNLPDIPKDFAFNPGKKQIIFSPEHPYFKNIDKKDLPLAQRNFDFKLPDNG